MVPFILELLSKNNQRAVDGEKIGIKSSITRPKVSRLNENNNDNDICNEIIDQRRTVFVSLIGLFQTYQKCPSYILYSSLLIIPLKQEWIYEPDKYENELQTHFVSNLSVFSQDKNETINFIKFIKWKDSQGFVFWALDDYDDYICNDNELYIAPFWHYFSLKLSSLYDGVTRSKYKSVKFASKWWQNSFDNERFSKYDTKFTLILYELYFFGMKYKTMQEIIYQSNPKSLNPVIYYGQNNGWYHQEKHGWYISTDYDPYDL